MFDAPRIAEQYLALWNETHPDVRRQALADGWAEQAVYVDPLVAVVGHEQINATIAAAQSQFPGFAFRLSGSVDSHHTQLRFGWELGPENGEAPIGGFDVIVCDADGRVRDVRGFLDRVPEA